MQLGISCDNELCTVIALVPWLINNGVEMTTGVSKYLFLIILVWYYLMYLWLWLYLSRSSPYYLHPKRIDTWTVANPLYAYVHLCWIWGFHFLKVGTSRLGASGFGYHRSTANLSRTFGAGAHEARGRENATLSMHTFWKCGPSIRVSGGWGVYFLGSHLHSPRNSLENQYPGVRGLF